MTIDFNVLARLTKLIALLGFFLPWVAVSCSGKEIATGTGWGLMTGHLDPSPQLAIANVDVDGTAAEGVSDYDFLLHYLTDSKSIPRLARPMPGMTPTPPPQTPQTTALALQGLASFAAGLPLSKEQLVAGVSDDFETSDSCSDSRYP